jgi:DNA-binding MarR family transcriptional regulator
MDISFDYYKVFYEVARCQNITQAALNLCLTQPTVTKYIHNLEDMLQCKLFNRSQKGVTLTDEGRILFRQINLPADGTRGRDFKRIYEQSERQGFDRCERADDALLSASLY